MEPFDLSIPDDLLSRSLAAIPVGGKGGWADLFLERCETIRAEWEGRSGVRITPGLREGFALRSVGPAQQRHLAVEGIDPDRIRAACRTFAAPGTPSAFPRVPDPEPETPPGPDQHLIATALQDAAAAVGRKIGPGASTQLVLDWRRRRIRIAASGQPVRSDTRTRAVLTLRLTSPERDFIVGRGADDLEALLKRDPAEQLVREVSEGWEERSEGREAPGGETVVVLARGTGGIFFHEACGHALEGDLILREASVFRSLAGERVAPDFVGAMDDSTQPGLEGSYAWDDEGSPGRGTILITRGILRTFLCDRVTGSRLGRETTGNGRRESFRDLPLPRMSNTFLMAGEEDPEEIIRQTRRGVYVERLAGGRVDTATGDFFFRGGAGRLIEEGRLTAPLRPFALAGNGLAALRSLDRIGSDLSFGTGAGSCGKEGQQIPVAVGQPTIRLRSLAVCPA